MSRTCTLNLEVRVGSLRWTLKLGNIVKTILPVFSVVKIVPWVACSRFWKVVSSRLTLVVIGSPFLPWKERTNLIPPR